MKIILLTVGKTQTDYLRTAIDDYFTKINHYIPAELISVADIKAGKQMPVEERKAKEGDAILSMLQPSDRIVLLDEKGKEFTSVEFASFIEKQATGGYKRLVFIVGGPYGFSQSVRDASHASVSLSRMTFSHEMVRLFFAEQLYRAMTILRGEPYHHE